MQAAFKKRWSTLRYSDLIQIPEYDLIPGSKLMKSFELALVPV